jgi:hypothetical protein
VSADGKNLTSVNRTRMPDGTVVTNTTIRERTSAEKSGVWGSWKLVSFRTDAPSLMVVTVPDDQTIDLSQQMPAPLKFRAKLGGNDYPVAVSQMSSGMTVSISGVRDRTLDMVVKRDGKPIQFFTWTVSRDGRTLTEEDREPVSDKVILKQVFQRQ